MEEKIKEFLKQNYKYILIILTIIIIVGLLVVSYFYSNKVEQNVEVKKQNQIVVKEEKVEGVKKYIKVDIKGYVKKTGVYELEEGSRVIDVINASGGLLKDADTSLINLSKKITDEMVIIIYSKKEIDEYRKEKEIIKYVEVEVECKCPDTMNDACINKPEEPNEATEKVEENNEEIEENNKISINKATLSELQTLTGIGKSKAQSIISYREEKGSFKTKEEIMNVSGIGESLFEKIKDNITI